jgi:ribose-phosphate pyrophosphokinase
MENTKINSLKKDGVVVFSGNANLPLAEVICAKLGVPLGKTKVTRFADGEVKVNLEENVRKKEVFIIQSTNPPAESWDELCFLIDAARRASAREITAVIPYCGYSRQERKDEPHTSISLKLKLDQVAAAGANRIVACDLHAAATQGFVNIPFDNLFATPLLLENFASFLQDKENTCLVTDLGYGKVVGVYAKKLDLELVIARKIRITAQQNTLAEKIELIGKIKKNAIFLDDIADTFGTANMIGRALKTAGAEFLAAAMIHGVLSSSGDPKKDAAINIYNSPFEKIILTDTINIQEKTEAINRKNSKIEIITVDALIAQAIKEIYEGGSVSQIFERGIERVKNLFK